MKYERFAGWSGIAAGGGGFLYAVAFVIIARVLSNFGNGLAAAMLVLVGLLVTALLTGLYGRLHEVDPGFARWALLLGVVAALGSAAHGGYDLANVVNPPASNAIAGPNQVDPRGLLTFGVSGLSVLTWAWLVSSAGLPRGLAALGYLNAALLLILYLARLVVLNANSPAVLLPAIVDGFVVNPLWYVGLGRALLREA